MFRKSNFLYFVSLMVFFSTTQLCADTYKFAIVNHEKLDAVVFQNNVITFVYKDAINLIEEWRARKISKMEAVSKLPRYFDDDHCQIDHGLIRNEHLHIKLLKVDRETVETIFSIAEIDENEIRIIVGEYLKMRAAEIKAKL